MSGRFGVVPEVGEVGIRNSLKPLLHSSTVASEVTEMVEIWSLFSNPADIEEAFDDPPLQFALARSCSNADEH
jgi:hypothetical protein